MDQPAFHGLSAPLMQAGREKFVHRGLTFGGPHQPEKDPQTAKSVRIDVGSTGAKSRRTAEKVRWEGPRPSQGKHYVRVNPGVAQKTKSSNEIRIDLAKVFLLFCAMKFRKVCT